ncbi:L-seryl-tRNA(Sec) selenium transferase [Desulforegula conservatrix]|uniref:L-seryl-tRNA(Sec) selenium transferase n=1 Tax=Desulforegula conservatrix TaxID=153026 RepID=UPI0004265ADD|nr:L-seryl-tRNA(Sec) selenium transferase [Desulforegula conservatrix]
MKKHSLKNEILKKLPKVDGVLLEILENSEFDAIPRSVILKSARETIETERRRIIETADESTLKNIDHDFIINEIMAKSLKAMKPNLIPLVNATGVVIHTNLGRSPLCRDALDQIMLVARGFSNLEFNLATGKRGIRYAAVEELVCEISGAEAAMAVNNNAAAVMLCLDTLARGREAIVSRGELVEIGGSFRIPDVMTKSGAILREIGTTNRTHLRDYEAAINENTALILKVHTSNFAVMGFTSNVPLSELSDLGKKQGIPVMEDLGSGTFIDFSKYGMVYEPTVQESVASGADVISFSGDKLLGGPQAGIIVGKKEIIAEIRKNPLTRALRIDKMTLAGLEATLRHYREEKDAVSKIPTLRMLTMPVETIEAKALALKNEIDGLNHPDLEARILPLSSKAGGGSLPAQNLPSKGIGLSIKNMSANRIEKEMRGNTPPVIGRIEEDLFIMDLRTIEPDEFDTIKEALALILQKYKGMPHV